MVVLFRKQDFTLSRSTRLDWVQFESTFHLDFKMRLQTWHMRTAPAMLRIPGEHYSTYVANVTIQKGKFVFNTLDTYYTSPYLTDDEVDEVLFHIETTYRLWVEDGKNWRDVFGNSIKRI